MNKIIEKESELIEILKELTSDLNIKEKLLFNLRLLKRLQNANIRLINLNNTITQKVDIDPEFDITFKKYMKEILA